MIAIDLGDQCDTFIFPFFGLSLVFQCSFVKEQAAKAQQIIGRIEDLPGVSYTEASLGRGEVLRARSQLFDPLPTTLSDLSSALQRVSPDVGQIIEDIGHAAAAGGGTFVHRLVRTAGEN
jgi:copper chaperone CopZ